MGTCTRRTIEDQSCRNPTRHGDCGRHPAQVPVHAASIATGGLAAQHDPFAAARITTESLAAGARPDPAGGWEATTLAGDHERLVARARALTEELTVADAAQAVLDRIVPPEPPPVRHVSDYSPGEARTERDWRIEWNDAWAPPPPAWSDAHLLARSPSGQLHVNGCDRAGTTSPVSVVPADHADADWCPCTGSAVPRTAGLRARHDRYAAAHRQLDALTAVADLNGFPGVADVRRLAPHTTSSSHVETRLRDAAAAHGDKDAARWLRRTLSRLEVLIADAPTRAGRRAARSMADAIAVDGHLDPADIVEIGTAAANGPLTRAGSARRDAQAVFDTAARWAAGDIPTRHDPGYRRDRVMTSAPGLWLLDAVHGEDDGAGDATAVRLAGRT